MRGDVSQMSPLDSLVRVTTGPKCLRSGLRRETAPVRALLTALDSPAELQVSIPAAVFGGDIFNVMSDHLRAALVVQPPATVTTPSHPGRRSFSALPSSASIRSENPFFSAGRTTRSTLQSGTTLRTAETNESESQPFAARSNSSDRLAQEIAALQANARESFRPSNMHDATSRKDYQNARDTQDAWSARTKRKLDALNTPSPAALVHSLDRYWKLLHEARNKTRVEPPVTAINPPTHAHGPATDPASGEQQNAARAWPSFAGRDLAEKLRGLSDSSANQSKLSMTAARLNSPADHQIQNVFNIEVKNESPHESNLTDLADRIAEILNEQALQHGIDVT